MMELVQLDFVKAIEGVKAFSTTRGEVDRRYAYSGVNLCDYVGDDALRVLDARLTLAMQLGVDLDDLVMPRQTHSCRVAVIDEDFRSMDIDRQEAAIEGVDALVIPTQGLSLSHLHCRQILYHLSHQGSSINCGFLKSNLFTAFFFITKVTHTY